MSRMRHPRPGPNARAGCEGQARRGRDLREGKRIELRRDLALEPRFVALARMLARPVAIAAMPLADRLAAHTVHGGGSARIVARSGLRCERLACSFDRAQPMLAPRLDAFTLAEIGAATGLSLAACSRVRAGARVPHPRHWEALRELADS
jgi:hypothetical protein